jgi:hypothetical protein
VEIRHAWYVEHKSPLGSASDFDLISALTPKKKGDPTTPSQTLSDYEVPQALPDALANRVATVRDLMADAYAFAGA